MQATQTQQSLHSVLEARGLFFMFLMTGLSLCLVFWVCFFQIGSEQPEFKLSFPQHDFPPSCARRPSVGFV